MKRTSMHSLEPSSARKRIAAAKSNKPFMAALLDRGHREHKDAVEQWTGLHQAAFPEPITSAGIGRNRSGGWALPRSGAISIGQGASAGEPNVVAPSRRPSPQTKGRLQGTAITEERRDSVDVREGGDEMDPPVLNSGADRIRALLEDAPARFEIKDNSEADPNYGVWRSVHAAGAIAVRLNEAVVEREAEAQGVDADLVKAIMYVENAHGWYGHGPEAFGVAKSLFPMNIKSDPWAGIDNPPADLDDPETNIRIAVTLIRRISERIDEPTPARVASIWNFTGRESVNDYGARVQDAYENRLWDFEHDPTEMP